MSDRTENQMTLDEYQEWMQRGLSARDAAFGLLFHAVDLVEQTGRQDKIPIYLEVAKITTLLELERTLDGIRRDLSLRDQR